MTFAEQRGHAMLRSLTQAALLLALTTSVNAQPGPIIDIHWHAPRPAEDDPAARAARLAEMEANGIVLSALYMTEPSDLDDWAAEAPGRFIAGPALPCWPNTAGPAYYCFIDSDGWPDLAWLEQELASGRIGLMGEMLFTYANVAPDDPRMAPYWALAAKYDVPVAVHTGRGPGPGQGPRDETCCPEYNEAFGNPEHLGAVLAKHPKLRLVLQHFGAGDPPTHAYFTDEALALLRDYPSVYVDMTIINSIAPPEAHEAVLKGLIDAGFGHRILFGSDNLPVAPILERMEAIAWLTPEQRSAIYYDNAARFLRLDAATIAKHRAATAEAAVRARTTP